MDNLNDVGRNDLCPCGSGKKFKKCHEGREDELLARQLERMAEDAGAKITALPLVEYGRCREFANGLDWSKITGTKVGVKFVDLRTYLALGLVGREIPADLDKTSAGQMINPLKTISADPNHLYLAVTPAVSDSTLIHQLAHVLDYVAGSHFNTGLAQALGAELNLPPELIEHPKEFGDWLAFLANEFAVALDAEDAIVFFLHENGYLIPGEVLSSGDHGRLETLVKRSIEYLRRSRDELDARIKGRAGYRGPKTQDQQ